MEYQSRKLPRLKNYDYSQNGCYFITICTKDKQRLLSSIVGNAAPGVPQIILTDYGRAIETEIQKMNGIYQTIQTTDYVIMPNHVHMLVEIDHDPSRGTPGAAFPTKSLLSEYVRTFKRFCNKECGNAIWQKSFYDHIIRDEEDHFSHVQYINENPKKWLMGKDEYYA